ncbi:NAD(P)H-dependent oxidoreductase [Candidatus Saccharibacteria bacterium]|nr:NAD(P)H-dependent oxidoreductase [Candidatus Saccharibacteria bacterium]
MKRKVLVVLGHPDSKGFNNEIFDTFVKNIDRTKSDVKTLQLGKMKFDPVLRFGYRKFMKPDAEIEKSQELVKWADHIVFIYPIWWSSMPSLLKGWIDRVFTPGYAYNMKSFFRHDGHLAGRTAELIMTSDGPGFYYKFLAPTPTRLMRNHILKLCGIKVKKVRIFGQTGTASSERKAKFLEKIAKGARNV